MQTTTFLILGAGPTGLGAAHALAELGRRDFLVLEAESFAGGLSASFRDPAGFTWDFGGHVLFSHYPEFDALVDGLMAGEMLEHQRMSLVRCAGAWVPYPFQNNVRHLPPAERWRCVQGLLPGRRPTAEPRNFSQWIETVFGRGIGELFMWPYNFKVWATPPEFMSAGWIGERVSVVDLEGVLRNIVLERDDVAWGPNNAFRFPARGGTGEIFRRLAARLADHIHYKSPVARIDARARTVRTADGREIGWTHLLNTGPLDRLVTEWLESPDPALVEAARGLAHNAVHVTGIGVDDPGLAARPADPRCWMYFPEADCPFYRVTHFHHYSPENAARPGAQRALMCETASSAHKPEDPAALPGRSAAGLTAAGLLTPAEAQAPATVFSMSREYAYPVPTLTRDAALRVLQPRLEALDIWSRGRFGGWRYEVGNMDHSVMQGIQWARRVAAGQPETVYAIP